MTQRALAMVLLLGCSSAPEVVQLDLPEGFPAFDVPEANPLTAEKVTLGRHLFYDTRLSGNGEQSCASCHEQQRAFTDGRPLALGSTGVVHPRNSSALVNVAYNATQTWANPELVTLEQQILVPIFSDAPIELGATDAALDAWQADDMMSSLFADAFPDDAQPVGWDQTVDALASFSRTLISGNSTFDQYTYQGDRTVLTDAEKRGMVLFYSEKLECHHCHGGFNFSEATTHDGAPFDAERYHNTGLYNIDGEGGYPLDNTGLYEFTLDPNDMGRFRPPTLRNVAVTAPYMHDGSIDTLEEVIRHYERGGRLIEEGPYAGDGSKSPLKSGLVPGFSLTDEERMDLIAFLNSLTDEDFLNDPQFSNPFLTP